MGGGEHCTLPDCYQKMVVVILSILCGIPDMILQYAWISYQINRQPRDSNLDLLAFRREIVDIYLKKYVCRNESGRPRGKISPARSKMRFTLIELTILAVPLRHKKNMCFVAKTQGKDAVSVMLAFATVALKNGMVFNRLKHF